jgi:hypothetical protein
VAEALPFEMLASESPKAWAAFCVYRDLSKDRSIDTAYEVATGRQLRGKRAPGSWQRWATEYNWVERARSYDAALDARARAATEGEATERRRRMIERHAQTAAKLQTAAQMILDEFNDRVAVRGGMKFVDGRMLVSMLNQVSKMLETGQKLERLAEGEPTEHITYERVMSMSDAEFEMLVRRLETEGQV